MTTVKYVILFVWALLLLGTVCYLIKRLFYAKRKTDSAINMSEAIFVASLIISTSLVLQKVMQYVSIAFDTILKIKPGEVYLQFIKTSSAISVCGIILLGISLLISKFLSTVFFGKTKDIIEFDADNIPFSLIRAILMISVSIVFLQLGESIFNYLIPSITIPFYR